MKDLIACCGLDCDGCDARKATINNDDALRERTVKLWAEANNAPIKAEHINCMGCRVEGVKYIYCRELCPVRKCVKDKGFDTCADCAEIDTCQLVVETFISLFSILIVIVELGSFLWGYSFMPRWCGWIGLALTAFGVGFFIAAVLRMRDSCRAGVAVDDNTRLVTSGVYGISRNPAFVGFDLTYVGLLLCFANWLHLVVVICTVVAFHFQILQEERFLLSRKDIDYMTYYNRVRRYL